MVGQFVGSLTDSRYLLLKASRRSVNTELLIPLLVPTCVFTAGGELLQVPDAALPICVRRSLAEGVPVPAILTHAAVFVESACPLLVMNLIGLPQPFELKTSPCWNGQLLRPIGNTHGTGGYCGCAEVAMADVATVRLIRP